MGRSKIKTKSLFFFVVVYLKFCTGEGVALWTCTEFCKKNSKKFFILNFFCYFEFIKNFESKRIIGVKWAFRN